MAAATTDRPTPRPPLRMAAGDLEVVFEWEGDRWRHRIAHRGRLVAESVEGPGDGGDDRWPRSPALQEVSAGGGDRPVLLAVGSAGRSHFSASVAADPSRPDTVLVEVACRVHERPEWLGSTYRLGTGGTTRIRGETVGDPPCTVRWACRVGPEGVGAADRPVPPGAG